MTTPYTISHSASTISSSISKVVNRQQSGVLANDANIAENSVIKSYIDTSVASLSAAFYNAEYSYTGGSTTVDKVFGGISENSDNGNIAEVYQSTGGTNDGIKLTSTDGVYLIAFEGRFSTNINPASTTNEWKINVTVDGDSLFETTPIFIAPTSPNASPPPRYFSFMFKNPSANTTLRVTIDNISNTSNASVSYSGIKFIITKLF